MGSRFRPGRILRLGKSPIVSKIKGYISTCILMVLNALAPKRCLSCKIILGTAPLALPLCPTCSLSIFPLGDKVLASVPNLARPNHPLPVVSLFAYQGIIPELVLKLKYSRAFWLGKDMGKLVAAVVASYGPFDYIVSVPAAHKRQLKRGYNPVALLSIQVSRLLGIPTITKAIIHRGKDSSQRNLNAAQRWERASLCFVRGKAIPRGARILLIDDVITTGATLTACANILLDSGASSIMAATVASALTP